jgi:hypothetical protein
MPTRWGKHVIANVTIHVVNTRFSVRKLQMVVFTQNIDGARLAEDGVKRLIASISVECHIETIGVEMDVCCDVDSNDRPLLTSVGALNVCRFHCYLLRRALQIIVVPKSLEHFIHAWSTRSPFWSIDVEEVGGTLADRWRPGGTIWCGSG